MQLHILRGMKAEVITAFVAMCIHGRNMEPVMVAWILWISPLCFILGLGIWYLVYLLHFNIQEGSCELRGC
jgi:biotin transporter BioY